MKSMTILFCLFMSLNAFAKVKVIALVGEVTFGGKVVKETSILRGAGELVVARKSYVRLLLVDSGSVLAFGAGTSAYINTSQKKELPVVNLTKGLARWLTGVGGQKNTGGFKTKNSVLGIRGTDFFISYGELLNETEVICFDGEVQFTSSSKSEDSQKIKKGQWGGLGGRFGDNVSNILDLPADFLERSETLLPVK